MIPDDSVRDWSGIRGGHVNSPKEGRQMPDGEEFRIVLGEAVEQSEPAEDREGVVPADLRPSPQSVLAALKATPGSEDIIMRIPGLNTPKAWQLTAYFSVCSKTGTALYLDIWDNDHLDGVADMQRCLDNCWAWFSADGGSGWGSPQTKTGRINCYFTVPAAGPYLCTAALAGLPSANATGAEVECLIDNYSFGTLSFTGTIYQPFPCNLGAGGRHFRIRQISGAFLFLSVSVYSVGVFA
jgi:hypothetical protein